MAEYLLKMSTGKELEIYVDGKRFEGIPAEIPGLSRAGKESLLEGFFLLDNLVSSQTFKVKCSELKINTQ